MLVKEHVVDDDDGDDNEDNDADDPSGIDLGLAFLPVPRRLRLAMLRYIMMIG